MKVQVLGPAVCFFAPAGKTLVLSSFAVDVPMEPQCTIEGKAFSTVFTHKLYQGMHISVSPVCTGCCKLLFAFLTFEHYLLMMCTVMNVPSFKGVKSECTPIYLTMKVIPGLLFS